MYSLSVDEIINKKGPRLERREQCSPSCFSGRFPEKGFINQVWDVQGIILKSLNNMYDKFWLINIVFLSHIFDFTFYLLGHYTSCSDITRSIRTLNNWCEPYSDEMPNSDLHWFVCDSKRSLVIEQTETGLHCYEANGVMTNNPPYSDIKDNYIFEKESIVLIHIT